MDIAVAGAGIAGLSCAAFLARDGHRVSIFDQFDEPAPIGSGVVIQSTGQAVLSRLALLEKLKEFGAPIERLYGVVAASGHTALDVRLNTGADNKTGVGIHRASLFHILFGAARDAGVNFETGKKIIGAGDKYLEFSGGSHSPAFDLLIDAMGVHSPLIEREKTTLGYGALWVNVTTPRGDAFLPRSIEQRYYRSSKAVGLMPIGKPPGAAAELSALFWNLRGDHFDDWRAHGLACWKDEVLALWPALAPVLEEILDADQFVFARYAHDAIASPVEGRLIHIGDAWHAASPQLGQGANMALLDAFALARSLREHSDYNVAIKTFLKLRHRHVQLYQAMSAMFTPVYQSDSEVLPLVRDALAGPLSGVWFVSKLLAAMVSGTLGAPSLENLK
ncbi:MAG: FAD-dependent monooxygenase [Marinicaulis sp.]|nr:FAD-dependent monooxygenase [Marinicaulis sp.]